MRLFTVCDDGKFNRAKTQAIQVFFKRAFFTHIFPLKKEFLVVRYILKEINILVNNDLFVEGL